MKRFGVDTGGTFTDVVARDAGGTLRVHKLLSTPDDPSRAIAEGVAALELLAGDELVHGTTVATNALLERKGARIALVTTAGFEDLLELRRQNRANLYALEPRLCTPLTSATIGVVERTLASGEVAEALCAAEIERVVEAVRAADVDAVAICLLHSYANPTHEHSVAAAIRKAFASVHVTASSDLVPEFREYERASTAAVNAYVGPVMAAYIGSLKDRLASVHTEVLLSSGGRASLEQSARGPVHTVLSGPAGGVVGAFAAAQELGIERIITFDMGGTSTDVSLCDGAPRVTYSAEVEGHPLLIPTLDVLTVGAGGGSVAYRDAGGALRVGPLSAGAVPGPAAYGRGGRQATVTDAHVVLGSLRPEAFLGGAMSLDAGAAVTAVESVAKSLGLAIDETARGILDVADAAMGRAIKVICSKGGHDPRDFALVAFGGAGGLHACRLASLLGIQTVIVPRHPGLLSAYGMLHASRTYRFAVTVLASLSQTALQAARENLSGHGRPGEQYWFAELRYEGQTFTLEIPLSDAATMRRAFHDNHEQAFGYRDEQREIQLVTVRLVVEQVAEVHTVTQQRPSGATPRQVAIDLGDGRTLATIVERAAELPGCGPAVLTEYSGTIVVPIGWEITRDSGHIVLRTVK